MHSRAARRAVSPSIDLDKKHKTVNTRTSASPPPHPASIKPHVLAAQSAGITKKQKSKPVKRAQRLRQLKGMGRAADNLDKLELKVAKSVGKEKKTKERRKGWEEVNGEKKKKNKGGNVFDALSDEDSEQRKEREWVSDEEMDEDGIDDRPSAAEGEVKQLEVVAPANVPLPVEVEDEML